MDQNKLAIASISQDLKRIAIGLHRGSNSMASRFADEALKTKTEIKQNTLPPYIRKLLDTLDSATKDSDNALMYSTLFHNYSTKIL